MNSIDSIAISLERGQSFYCEKAFGRADYVRPESNPL